MTIQEWVAHVKANRKEGESYKEALKRLSRNKKMDCSCERKGGELVQGAGVKKKGRPKKGGEIAKDIESIPAEIATGAGVKKRGRKKAVPEMILIEPKTPTIKKVQKSVKRGGSIEQGEGFFDDVLDGLKTVASVAVPFLI